MALAEGLRHLVNSPLASCLFVYTLYVQCLLVLLRRILLPHLWSYQSLRTQLQRAWLISTYVLPALPVQCSEADAKPISERGQWSGYIIPGHRKLDDFVDRPASGAGRRVVALYAHGGGYAWGEARQYLSYMRRWVSVAKAANIDLVFLSVEYPLSGEAPHPAQLNAFVSAYKYLLALGISPSNIVFMGDSAGGGLSTLSALSLLHHRPSSAAAQIPQPSACILISPWLDLSGEVYANGGNALVETDFVDANVLVPMMSAMFIGKHDPTDPQVNPLLHEPAELEGLCPQLILVGGAEFALQDSKVWAAMLKKAGVEYELVVEKGQIHIYAMGSEWLEPAVRTKTEGKIMEWMGRGGGAGKITNGRERRSMRLNAKA